MRKTLMAVAALICAAAPPSYAKTTPQTENTFVGNGGNAGDLELELTVRQIKQIVYNILIKPESDLTAACVCPPEYKGRAICEPLASLNDDQQKYCIEHVKGVAKQIQDLLEAAALKFDWTEHPMSVQEEGGARAADAVANVENNRVTINRSHFLDEKPPERVFLLAHELLHFADFDSKKVKDDEAVGPFQSRDGGRKLLNAMATTIAMNGHTSRVFDKTKGLATRSKNYANNWFTLELSLESDPLKSSTFDAGGWSGGSFEYRRQFTTDWGAFIMARELSAKKSVLTSTTATGQQNMAAAGVSWRYMPFRDPMSWWGQSNLVVSLGAEYDHITYKLDDGFTTDEDSADSWAGLLRAQYYLPFKWGFWWVADVSITNHNFSLNQGSIESQPIQGQYNIGVAYAF